MKTFTLACAVSITVSSALTLNAYEDYDPYQYHDRLTGNWGGLRTELYDDGVELFAYYNAIIASNVSGGIRSETNYAGDLFAGMQLDMEKLAGWENWNFQISAIDRHGSDITPAVGSQYSVMQLVGGQTTFLYNVTAEKTFFDGDLSFKAGRMTATDDFVGSPFYSYSLNNAVNGQIRAVLFDGVMTSYPFAVWGGRVQGIVDDEHTFRLGLFQLTQEMWDPSNHGIDFSIDSGDGVSIFAQYDWTPELDGKPFRLFAGLNQTFAFDMPQFGSTNTTDEFTRFYGGVDYQVYRESPDRDEGLTLFLTFAYTDQEDVAIMPIQSSFGAHYKGLLPNRPDDRLVTFFTYGQFSDDYSDSLVSAGGSSVDNEMVLEVGYRIAVTDSAYIQPDLQYVINPGGTGNISNATVLGIQFGASF
ncbi:carbohydrate porin [Cerasicoccus maritimus]|uniref:carbohydrate porin n=1 Tax=Cerasicoccus maritimus TaxID=490089 RepID=UPI0028527A5B|nr:carbohydrate porin [Cerasicoccus maritimus]